MEPLSILIGLGVAIGTYITDSNNSTKEDSDSGYNSDSDSDVSYANTASDYYIEQDLNSGQTTLNDFGIK